MERTKWYKEIKFDSFIKMNSYLENLRQKYMSNQEQHPDIYYKWTDGKEQADTIIVVHGDFMNRFGTGLAIGMENKCNDNIKIECLVKNW